VPRRLDVVARGTWQRAAGANGWGAGAAFTLYAPIRGRASRRRRAPHRPVAVGLASYGSSG
jgi:hypothetical protein